MKLRLSVVLGVLALFTPMLYGVNCTVKCPKGYLGVCVEADGECTCRCAKDASAGAEAIAEILRTKGAETETVQRAVSTYKEMAHTHVTDFSFTVTEGQRAFKISGSLDVGVLVN